MTARGKASPKKLMLAERRQRAIVLRKAGATYEKIATVIAREFAEFFPSYSRSMAFRDVVGVLQHIEDDTCESAAIMRRLESERLDMAGLAVYLKMTEGDLQAVDRWLKVIEVRCKLWGLNLPPAERPIAETTTSGIEFELIMPDLVESRN